MPLSPWELEQRLVALLHVSESEARQVFAYVNTLPDAEAREHLHGLLGDDAAALEFLDSFTDSRHQAVQDPSANANGKSGTVQQDASFASRPQQHGGDVKIADIDSKPGSGNVPLYNPPKGPPPSSINRPSAPPQPNSHVRPPQHQHTNEVIQAAQLRARDEQQMQQMLQDIQYRYDIFNSDIEPEHESEYYCSCPIHQYQAAKYRRYPVQRMWSDAVMYPGEKAYDDNQFRPGGLILGRNPYRLGVVSPYGYFRATSWNWIGPPRPDPDYYTRFIHQTIQLNNSLNRKAQIEIDAKEPKHNIWAEDLLETTMSNMTLDDKDRKRVSVYGEKGAVQQSSINAANTRSEAKSSGFSKFRKAIGIQSSEERAAGAEVKKLKKGNSIKEDILAEENGRWSDEYWRQIVVNYQAKVGMTEKIAELRTKQPIQYLHLLRAGYFEPIPVAWADQASNPLKFSIEAAAGWRGITPAWRGYEDTAEERLYWVLNHRINPEGATLTRLKPDFISEMNMARARMDAAVEPPPLYFSANDTCHLQHTSKGYSRQVMPPPFRPYDRPETPSDDTMILLDVSGSMDFDPVRPVYNQYLITRYQRGMQPKNKDVAKAIIRRFTDAMANHDHSSAGYDLVTFANHASYIGTVNHRNLDQMWQNVRLGGGTRVMTGWQKVKDLHFRKHSESATYHPIYGWQAGPETPMLRLLLLLDGEATDMDEFELDLLGLSWAHVTIFLIGVDGCPHHHRHANELQRISDVNHHVNFVDAQGNCPERFVTHELLKRHLGYDVSMSEFEEMEQPPPYDG